MGCKGSPCKGDLQEIPKGLQQARVYQGKSIRHLGAEKNLSEVWDNLRPPPNTNVFFPRRVASQYNFDNRIRHIAYRDLFGTIAHRYQAGFSVS